MGQQERGLIGFRGQKVNEIMEFGFGGRLSELDALQLEVLIPERLLELAADPSQVQALRFDEQMGRLDQEFLPALGLLVVEKDAFGQPKDLQEEEPDRWGNALNRKRIRAIREGLIAERDKVSISLIADDRWSRHGVCVESYIDAGDLRGKGLGRAFLGNLYAIFAKMGYRYVYGENNPDNIGFFRKMGGYTLSDIKDEHLSHGLMPPLLLRNSMVTVKFLDRRMEVEYVQPECLKPDKNESI